MIVLAVFFGLLLHFGSCAVVGKRRGVRCGDMDGRGGHIRELEWNRGGGVSPEVLALCCSWRIQ